MALRSDLLRRLRAFFQERDFTEVETPLVAAEVLPERHIEPFVLPDGTFLQASPELFMKRLLAAGSGPIYQVTRSFRRGERGRLHRPEFTIIEWYRPGDDMQAGIDLLDQLCQHLLGTPPALRTSYADAFGQHAGVCPHGSSLTELAAVAERIGSRRAAGPKEHEGEPLQSTSLPPFADRDDLLNYILATSIEPHLGRDAPEIIYDYPASQAALAVIRDTNEGDAGRAAVPTSPPPHLLTSPPTHLPLAERFELYYRGIELANGYHELTDATELRERLTLVNQQRRADGRAALPLPESLLAAMEAGLPPSAGCALGFDRLLMLAAGAESIGEVMDLPPAGQ